VREEKRERERRKNQFKRLDCGEERDSKRPKKEQFPN
jgi:hypothetical protein